MPAPARWSSTRRFLICILPLLSSFLVLVHAQSTSGYTSRSERELRGETPPRLPACDIGQLAPFPLWNYLTLGWLSPLGFPPTPSSCRIVSSFCLSLAFSVCSACIFRSRSWSVAASPALEETPSFTASTLAAVAVAITIAASPCSPCFLPSSSCFSCWFCFCLALCSCSCSCSAKSRSACSIFFRGFIKAQPVAALHVAQGSSGHAR
jgi:hypothetical protein